MQNFRLWPLVLLFIFLPSCFNQISLTRPQLSSPDWRNRPQKKHLKTLLIAATNNFQGKLNAKTTKDFKVGGSKVLKSYFNILQKRYPGELLKIDAGGFLGNSSSLSSLNLIKYYQEIGYDAIGMNLSDLKNVIALNKNNQNLSQKIPLINSNIFDLKQNGKISKNAIPYQIIVKNNIKIGIVSLNHYMENKKQKNLNIYIEDPVRTFLKLHQYLTKKKKVDIIIALANFATYCSSKRSNNKNTPTLNCSRSSNKKLIDDQLLSFVKRIPPNKVDAIVANGQHFAEGFLNGIPILQNPGLGLYISRLHLIYDSKNKILVKNKTKILPPLKVCHYFYRATFDCFEGKRSPSEISKLEKTSYEKIPAKFLGYSVL